MCSVKHIRQSLIFPLRCSSLPCCGIAGLEIEKNVFAHHRRILPFHWDNRRPVATLSGFPFTQITFFNARPPLLVKHQIAGYAVVLLGVSACSMKLFPEQNTLAAKQLIIYIFSYWLWSQD